MKKISEKVVFFGSGPVAAAALKLLLEEFSVEAVITKPNLVAKPGELSVLDVVSSNDLKVLTPQDKSSLDELFASKPVTSRLAILIDYGIIVSQAVIDYFPLGIINSHFSLLPLWRGADPITFAILSGDHQTGVSLMLINAQMDEGMLLAQSSLKINDRIDGPTLTDQLIKLSNDLIKHTLPKYLSGSLKPYPQPGVEPTYSRKLTKQDGKIDWSKPAVELDRQIRAFIVWPKSYTELAGKSVIVTKAHASSENGESGKVTTKDNLIKIYCHPGSLIIEYLKPAGKVAMSSQAFLAGYRDLLN